MSSQVKEFISLEADGILSIILMLTYNWFPVSLIPISCTENTGTIDLIHNKTRLIQGNRASWLLSEKLELEDIQILKEKTMNQETYQPNYLSKKLSKIRKIPK